MALQFIVAITITKIIVLELGAINNGFYELSNDFVNYATVATIALNSMATRFIIVSYYKKKIETTNCYFNSLLYGDVILSFFFVVISIPIVLFLHKVISIPTELINDVRILFLFVFINFSLSIFFSAYGVSIFIKNRIDLESKRSIEGNIIKLVVLLGMLHAFEPKIWFIGFSCVLSTVYTIIRNIQYTRLLIPEISLFKKRYFRFEILKELISSGIWNSITKIGSIFLTGLDLLIVNQFVSSMAMGVLSISKIIPKYIFSSVVNFSSVFTPKILIEYAKGDLSSLITTISSSIKIIALFSIIIEVVVLVLSEQVFVILFPNQNHHLLYNLCIISIIGYIFLMPFEVLWTVFVAKNMVKISCSYLILESVLVITIVLFFMSFDFDNYTKLYIVAGVSSVFEMLRAIVFLPIASAIMLKIKLTTFYFPLIKNTLALLGSFIIGYLIVWLIFPVNVYDILVSLILIVLSTFSVCLFILFSKKERIKIKNLFVLKLSR